MGVYLSEPNTEKNSKFEQGKLLSYTSAEMQGWRKTMEDACIHIIDMGDGNSLFAVFDGHGGFQVSSYVSSIFERQLKALKSYQNKAYKKALDEIFKLIDELIQSPDGQKQLHKIRYGGQNSQTNEAERQMIGASVGCTANVVLITPTSYIVANAGDSRSVLSRNGKAIDLSKDHKPESPQEEARVKKAGGQISMGRVNGGLNLTRSFGDFDYKRNKNLPYDEQMITCKPDIQEFQRTSQDQFILLGCDGIWQKYVDNSQGIIDIVGEEFKKSTQPKKLIQNLLDYLLAKDTSLGIGCDNMTSVLIILNQ